MRSIPRDQLSQNQLFFDQSHDINSFLINLMRSTLVVNSYKLILAPLSKVAIFIYNFLPSLSHLPVHIWWSVASQLLF